MFRTSRLKGYTGPTPEVKPGQVRGVREAGRAPGAGEGAPREGAEPREGKEAG